MKSLGYSYVGGKKLKNGITTGTCATAATKGALMYLVSGQAVELVELSLPNGQIVEVPIESTKVNGEKITCAVRKDAGDDPDVTNGILICSTVRKNGEQEIRLLGGHGVGRVTKSGLPVPQGEPAINPVPRRMLMEVCESYQEQIGGMDVTISVPEGERIAKRTLNPKLGILGGISILGTTGIVKPMSEEAFKDSLRVELEMYVKRGYKKLLLVPGNYGEDFCEELYDGQIPYPLIKISNFLGYMLEHCERLGVEEIIVVGDLGKLIKVSGGIFHTHSRMADCRMELMTAYGALLGASRELLGEIMKAPTTVAVIELLEGEEGFPLEAFYQMIVDKVTERMTSYCHDEVKISTILFSRDKGELGRCMYEGEKGGGHE